MSRIPDHLVERVLLGEATSEQRAKVLANDEARERLETLKAENAAFLEAHPADKHVGEIRRKLHVAKTRDAVQQRRDRWTLASALLVPLAAAAVLITVVPSPPADQPAGEVLPPSEEDGVIVGKGDARLVIYRQVRGKPVSLLPETVLREHDQLQLGFHSGNRATHGVLFSVDGRGAVTLHSPDDGNTALRRGRTLLPHAYELDDAPDFERFFLVTHQDKEPLDVDAVLDAAEDLVEQGQGRKGQLQLPAGLKQDDLTILKDVL